ncbi:uncharacterized protein [Euphorbia lathyris]|uniref:uncharacterized protein n=1 Tax=Euphorbia lathyris TaxID=212925 RepID=UPI0033137E04
MASTAMINTSNYNQKRPLMMLKDYLLDDLSSCSSSGFKSFPRRKCCTTVRLLLEIDLNNKNSKQPQQPHFKRSTSSSSAAAISALQKASKAVINAVKLLPFHSSSSVKSSSVSSRNRNRKGVIRLPRSISRRLFKNRKADHRERQTGKIREWKLFGEFLEEIEQPSPEQISTTANFTCDGDSSSSSTSINSNDNSWTDSEFTGHSSCSESYSSRNGAALGERDVRSETKVSDGEGEIVGGDSVTYSVENTKEWGNEEEKEQFSPVSVLDCPFQDEEEDDYPFQRSLLCIEGSTHKFTAKMRKFGIEPVNLEKQIEDEQNKSSTSEHNEQEKSADELLKLVKSRIPQNCLSITDSLLLDFFKEKLVEKNGMVKGSIEFDEEIEVANKWVNGEVEDMFLGWEVKDKRHVYIRDMERNGSNWRNLRSLDEDKEEVVLELELELFTSLVNEALFDRLS